MPRGPNGERRPADAAQCAVQVARLAIQEIPENLPSNKRNGGKAGGQSRAKKLDSGRRSEIARQAAQTRWASG